MDTLKIAAARRREIALVANASRLVTIIFAFAIASQTVNLLSLTSSDRSIVDVLVVHMAISVLAGAAIAAVVARDMMAITRELRLFG